MNQKEIKELIDLLVEKDITEFELERGDMKVHVKRGSVAAPVVQVSPVVASHPLASVPVTSTAAARCDKQGPYAGGRKCRDSCCAEVWPPLYR